jgi:hypothetical protein
MRFVAAYTCVALTCVALACVALACGAPPRVAKPVAPAYVVKQYAPLAFKVDANAAQHAVILGTDDKDGSTLLPLAAGISSAAGALPPAASATGSNTTAVASPAPPRDTGVVDLVVATMLDKNVADLSMHAKTRDASARAAIELVATLTGTPLGKNVVDGTLLLDGTIAAGTSVTDLSAAYAKATNTKLPTSLPVAEADMALDAATADVLQAKYKQWQGKLATQWGAILQLESAGRLPSPLVHLRNEAKRLAESAELLRKQNQHAAAYARLLGAIANATSANQIYDVLTRVQANQLDKALAALDATALAGDPTKVAFEAINAVPPTTVSAHLRTLAAFRVAQRAAMLVDLATQSHASARTYLQSLAGTPSPTLGGEPVAENVVARVAPPIVYATKIAIDTALATEQLEVVGGSDLAFTPSADVLPRLARDLSLAAAATRASFDKRVIEPFAARAKINADEARMRAKLLDVDYVLATVTADASGLHALAVADLAYLHATKLVATYEVLGIAIDAPRPLARIASDTQLDVLLAAAERNARAAARAARVATGAIPAQAKLSYQLARAGLRGSAADKLDALGQLWASTLASHTAVMLARN